MSAIFTLDARWLLKKWPSFGNKILGPLKYTSAKMIQFWSFSLINNNTKKLWFRWQQIEFDLWCLLSSPHSSFDWSYLHMTLTSLPILFLPQCRSLLLTWNTIKQFLFLLLSSRGQLYFAKKNSKIIFGFNLILVWVTF